MAFQLSYLDDCNVSFPTSYWKITNINLDLFSRSVTFTFSAFKDSDASTRDKRPIASRTYVIVGNTNPQISFSDIIQGLANRTINIFNVGYNLAKNTLDTPSGAFTTKTVERTRQIPKLFTDPETKQEVTAFVIESYTEQINDQPVMISFFKDATNV